MPKNKKSKGRPPKYVKDSKGKEIVGLSYNSNNGMFYVTSSHPRHYFKTGGRGGASTRKETYAFRRENAIQQFEQWKKLDHLKPEEQELQKLQNKIHKKALELIEDGYMDEYVYERAYDLISENPVEASQVLGIKNLIFLKDKNFYYPFTLDLVWELFQYHRYVKDKAKYKKYKHAWDKFCKDMKTKTIEGITQEKVDKWKDQLYQEYVDDDQIIEIFECLDVLFNNVLKHNYQSESIRDVVKLINRIYEQVS